MNAVLITVWKYFLGREVGKHSLSCLASEELAASMSLAQIEILLFPRLFAFSQMSRIEIIDESVRNLLMLRPTHEVYSSFIGK